MLLQNEATPRKARARAGVDLTDLAVKIKAEHAAAAEAVKRTVIHALAAGELLLKAKAHLKHGCWLPWLNDHCQVSERTARLYMQLARSRVELESKSATIADLTLQQAAALLSVPGAATSRATSAAASVKTESKAESAAKPKPTSAPIGFGTLDPKSIAVRLNSLSWVEADPALRVKFVDDVGPCSLWGAMTAQQRNACLEYHRKLCNEMETENVADRHS
jgi:hypothetical protein